MRVRDRNGRHRHARLIEERDALGLSNIILPYATGVRGDSVHLARCRLSAINLPASRRFAHIQNPERSKYKTRICVARRLTNTYSVPSSGLHPSPWDTSAVSPLNDFLMSQGSPYRRIRI